MTKHILEKDGLDGYLPTLVLPARDHIMVLEGIPQDVDVETAAREWASRSARANEDFFLAFKLDDCHFKVVTRLGEHIDERVAVCTVKRQGVTDHE